MESLPEITAPLKLLSTSYFPSIRYMREIASGKNVCIDLGEHFIKQTHRNRCEILGANGRLKLIVPLKKWRNNTPVSDIGISYSDRWQKLHWKSLESAYRSSPYFEYYEDRLRSIVLDSHYEHLSELNRVCLECIMDVLGLETQVKYVTEYQSGDLGEDLRREEFLKAGDQDGSMSYIQVFKLDGDFESNLSCLDLICNQGPNSINLLS